MCVCLSSVDGDTYKVEPDPDPNPNHPLLLIFRDFTRLRLSRAQDFYINRP